MESDLASFEDAALFKSLFRLYTAVQRLPGISIDWVSPGLDARRGSPTEGSEAEAARALDSMLMSTLALFLEGKWPSRLSQLLGDMSDESPSDCVGVALLLARCLPPPLPVAPEDLPKAALLMMPPSPMPLRRQSLALALAEEEALVSGQPLGTASPPNTSAVEGGTAPTSDVGGVADALGVVPVVPDALREALLHAVQARRDRWQSVLVDAGVAVQKSVARLTGSSCRSAVVALSALLVRLVDLLPAASAQELLVEPLLLHQSTLGRCMADPSSEANELPHSARGDPATAAGRVALLLAALAAHPAGRAALLSSKPALLGTALSAALQADTPIVRRAGLLVLHNICDCELSLAAYHVPPTNDDGGSGDLPPLVAIGPAVMAASSIAAEDTDGAPEEAALCAAQVGPALPPPSQHTAAVQPAHCQRPMQVLEARSHPGMTTAPRRTNIARQDMARSPDRVLTCSRSWLGAPRLGKFCSGCKRCCWPRRHSPFVS